MRTAVHPPTKRMLTEAEAATYCGLGASTFKSLVRVSPIQLGTRLRYDVRALDRWLDQQSHSEPGTGDDWLDKLDAN